MTESPSYCPKCGDALPFNAPIGICPACLMHAGLANDPSAYTRSQPGTGSFVPPTPQQLAKRFPNLEVLELLGRGGMGAVYKARQRDLDRLVAVKILPTEIGNDPIIAERFTREAKALAKLSHQNIVTVFDFGRIEDQFFFVMEFVDGTDLRHLIDTKAVGTVDALQIVRQICDALEFAHSQGVVHRDIKPENILIDRLGRVKVADFGLAKLTDGEIDLASLTGTQQIMGTLRYMAPEQSKGTKSVDHRADIFSLGVIFYELLTGDLPVGRFQAPSEKSQVDSRVDDVVFRALEQEPDRRYQNASEINVDLASIASNQNHQPMPSAAPPVQPRPVAPLKVPLGEKHDLGFSKKAIIGAVWSLFFLFAFIAVFTVRVSNPNPPEEFRPSYFAYMLSILSIPVAFIGITATVGTTTLGALALNDIHRTRGAIKGHFLAIYDVLVFPLLLLNSITLSLFLVFAEATNFSIPTSLVLLGFMVIDGIIFWLVYRTSLQKLRQAK